MESISGTSEGLLPWYLPFQTSSLKPDNSEDFRVYVQELFPPGFITCRYTLHLFVILQHAVAQRNANDVPFAK